MASFEEELLQNILMEQRRTNELLNKLLDQPAPPREKNVTGRVKDNANKS